MGWLNIVILSTLTVGVAVFFTLDCFEAERNAVISLIDSLHACPLHWLHGEHAISADGKYNVVSSPSDRLFTKEELAEYHGGEGSRGLYLGVLGRVYDVEKGERFYGEGGGYGFFRAIDGTKAFMTGEFNEQGLVDDIEGLTTWQMIELEDWIKFYDKTYIYKGKLVGNFYDQEGKPTAVLHEAVRLMEEAHLAKDKQEEQKKKFPPCNSSWKQNVGKRLWCSDKSGGIKRDWVGVPREYFTPGETSGQCVCARTSGPPSNDPQSTSNRGELDNPNLREYDNCDHNANECFFQT